MNPISPTGPNASPAAALFEAVVRYSSAGELRDQVSRAVDPAPSDDAQDVPTDQSILSPDEDAPAPGAGARPAETHHHAETGHAENHHSAEAGGHHHGIDADGMEQQQEALLAQQAADQHGRLEARRDQQGRVQRSTREMMRVDSASTEPTGADKSPRPPASKDAPPDDAGDADAASTNSPAGSAPAAAGGGPRLGGDLVAAAVGSGVHHLPEEHSHKRPVERDMDAEQVDGSQEATGTRAAHAGSRARRGSSMQSSLGFDGEGEEEGRDPARGGFGRSSGGGSSPQGDGEGTSRHQEQAPESTSRSGGWSAAQPREAEPDLGQPLLKATTPESDDYLPDPETAVEEASVPQEPESPPVSDEESPDTVERHVVLSPGIDLTSPEEYFFFDDVRYQSTDAAAGGN